MNPGRSMMRQSSVTPEARVSTPRESASFMLSLPASATSWSSGSSTDTSACWQMGPAEVLAMRMRSSPSKANGSVAKRSVVMPRPCSRLSSSPVAPPPVPPPRAVTTTAVRTPSRAGSMSDGVSWNEARAEEGSPPVPRPARRLPPSNVKGTSLGAPVCASVSRTSVRTPWPYARSTPRVIAAPAPPTPMRIRGDGRGFICAVRIFS